MQRVSSVAQEVLKSARHRDEELHVPQQSCGTAIGVEHRSPPSASGSRWFPHLAGTPPAEWRTRPAKALGAGGGGPPAPVRFSVALWRRRRCTPNPSRSVLVDCRSEEAEVVVAAHLDGAHRGE